MQSLQTKLGSGLIISLIAVFIGMWWLISFNIQSLAEDYITSRLRHDAEMLLIAVRIDRQAHISLDEVGLNPVYSQPFSGHYYRIQSNKQTLSSRSLWDRQLNTAFVQSGEQSRTHQPGPNQQQLLVVNQGFTKQGVSLSISTAEDLNPVMKNIQKFQHRFSIGAGLVLLLLVLLQVFILRQSLHPLARIRKELQALQQGETTQLNSEAPQELRPMINEINRLVGIMEQRLHRSRHALSDLAHELKKPLTVIQYLIDQNRNNLPEDIHVRLEQQTTSINQLTDRILKRARLAGPVHSGLHFSFSTDLPALIETLNMIYAEKQIDTQLSMSDTIHCYIDREDMLELLGNLLDNAYKWAEQKILITITSDTHINICVEDDGPGTDPEMFTQLDKRGVRLDESIPGHGFGLAIAADMVREYQGNLVFGRSIELGGFKVDIQLPINGQYTLE